MAGGTSEQIYIAGRIFDALNDAWATFQEQEKASDIYRMVFNVCVKRSNNPQINYAFKAPDLAVKSLLPTSRSRTERTPWRIR